MTRIWKISHSHYVPYEDASQVPAITTQANSHTMLPSLQYR